MNEIKTYPERSSGMKLSTDGGNNVNDIEQIMEQNANIILGKIGMCEVMAQLAEEAAELAQAALKYRRAVTGENPTPVSAEEAMEHLREEIADVETCLMVASDNIFEGWAEYVNLLAEKCERWVKRFKETKRAEE